MNDQTDAAKRRRGIYLLPNLFTTAGLFAGFYAIVAATKNHFDAASIAIFVAMVMDSLDGRIARLTNTQSDFGKEFDSLSDMVAFGLAPALVMYEWVLLGLGKLGWLAAFIYTAGVALRLARFNVQHAVVNKRYFQGLASPAAAGVLGGMVWVGDDYGLRDSVGIAMAVAVLSVAVALLMVSNIRYRSFKDLDLRNRVPFVAVLLLVLIFAFVSIDPPQVLFALFFGYAVSGPVNSLIFLRKRKQILQRRRQRPQEPQQ
ncbi:MAG: CDP-diacylglycerol--serine O-phosphatidyltransferase [Gammaproteobacteria bacterium]